MVQKSENIENNNLNKQLVDGFVNLIKQIEYDIDHAPTKTKKLQNMFRLKHMRHAIKVISLIPEKITSTDQLKGIKGIGKGILSRVDELLKTGKLGEIIITHDSDKYLSYVSELEQVYGIGRTKALELITQHNIKNVDELKNAVKNKKIELPDNILMGLKYYGVYKQQIPRSEVLEYDNLLHKYLHEIDPQLIGVVCGSYRRLSKVSNDIDLLIVHPNVLDLNDTYKHNFLFDFINKLTKKKNNC
jgi:DNA polymerase/3'-5' exonuclease PolX